MRAKLSAKSVLMDTPYQQILPKVHASNVNLHVRLALEQQLPALLVLVAKDRKDQNAKIKLTPSLK